MNKIFVSYAWAVGCWKSPITNYISTKLRLPTFNTDSVLSEVCEDCLELNREEAHKRVEKRLSKIIKDWISFIYDASVDRRWWVLKDSLIKYWYRCFIISIDLEKDTLLKFYTTKSYYESIKRIDDVYQDHQKFLKEFWADIDLYINENNYKERLDVVYMAVSKRIKGLEINENSTF